MVLCHQCWTVMGVCLAKKIQHEWKEVDVIEYCVTLGRPHKALCLICYCIGGELGVRMGMCFLDISSPLRSVISISLSALHLGVVPPPCDGAIAGEGCLGRTSGTRLWNHEWSLSQQKPQLLAKHSWLSLRERGRGIERWRDGGEGERKNYIETERDLEQERIEGQGNKTVWGDGGGGKERLGPGRTNKLKEIECSAQRVAIWGRAFPCPEALSDT